MGVLKSGVSVGEHRLGFKSFNFVNSSVQDVCFCFGHFSRELDSLMVFVKLNYVISSLVVSQR